MNIDKLKNEVCKIKMPADMKNRIAANCRNEKTEKNLKSNVNVRTGKIFKKPLALAAAIAACVCLTSVTVFAASGGLFTSIKKAFYNDENVLIAPEPSEYAFVADVNSISGDGVTVNVTEAMADDNNAFVFMDAVFENGVPEEILNDKTYNYESVCFENSGCEKCAACGSKCISADENTVSLYVFAKDIQENDLLNDGISVNIENLGYFVRGDKPFWDFKTAASVSGTVTIPPEQIKYNESKTAYAEINGLQAKMELSLLGFNVVFDSQVDYSKIEDEFICKEQINPKQVRFFMKDSEYSGCKILGSLSGGADDDGNSYLHFGFNAPVDIENIEKITLGDHEFCFE